MKANFQQLLDRLKAWLNLQVRNGALTERGLARRVGMSQSHIHNVLKGARILTPATADRILKGLGMTLFDLLEAADGAAAPAPGPAPRRRPRRRGRVSKAARRRPLRGRSPRPAKPSFPS
jgi:transcriptional regulator with XRE-family HTH domain